MRKRRAKIGAVPNFVRVSASVRLCVQCTVNETGLLGLYRVLLSESHVSNPDPCGASPSLEDDDGGGGDDRPTDPTRPSLASSWIGRRRFIYSATVIEKWRA